MQQNNEDRNYSLHKLHCRPPSKKTYQVPQPTTHRLFWKQQRRPIIRALQASCKSEAIEQL